MITELETLNYHKLENQTIYESFLAAAVSISCAAITVSRIKLVQLPSDHMWLIFRPGY